MVVYAAMKPKTYKYKGESKTLGEWAKQLGIPYNNLFMRLKQGWDFARAVEEPIRPRGAKGKKKGKGRRKRGAEAAGKNLQRVEEMFKGGFAEKFASAVTGSPSACAACTSATPSAVEMCWTCNPHPVTRQGIRSGSRTASGRSTPASSCQSSRRD